MTRKTLLSFTFALCVCTFSMVAAADIEVGMGPCTEKNYQGSYPKGGDCNYQGCFPAGAGCGYQGCWLPGGGCNYQGCWPAGGSCNYQGCTRVGECDYKGCPDKISGEKIKYTCDLKAEGAKDDHSKHPEGGASQPPKTARESALDALRHMQKMLEDMKAREEASRRENQKTMKNVMAGQACLDAHLSRTRGLQQKMKSCLDMQKGVEACAAEIQAVHDRSKAEYEDCMAKIPN